MPFFNLACTTDFKAICDCELACWQPGESSTTTALCIAACARDRNPCVSCGPEQDAYGDCTSQCSARHSVSGVACVTARDECRAANGGPACETEYTACLLASDTENSNCFLGCQVTLASAVATCQTQEALCRSDACEASHDSYSYRSAQCQIARILATAESDGVFYIAINACEIASAGCNAGCANAYSDALRSCVEQFPGGDTTACDDAAIAALNACGDACGSAFGQCSGSADAVRAASVAAAATALSLCQLDADNRQRQRDDRLDPGKAAPRNKAGVQGAAYASCVANGPAGSGGEIAYVAAMGQLSGQQALCHGTCAGHPHLLECIANCDEAFETAKLDLARSYVSDAFACCSVYAPHDVFAQCDIACFKTQMECETAFRIAIIHEQENPPFTCDSDFTDCRAKCWTDYRGQYDTALAAGHSVSEIERSCADCSNTTIGRVSSTQPSPL